MTMHLFGAVLTGRAVAANNRGENEGTVATLQKIVRNSEIHTTVSSEAMRYAIREIWRDDGELTLNRSVSHHGSEWKDTDFGKGTDKYIDNDVLGYMHAKKETTSRRGILEISRAVSTTPWLGTLSYNFASPGSNPMGNQHPIPYQAEVHDTRYQYGFAMTPASLLRDHVIRTEKTLRAIQNLRRVAGNHARYLYDFAPEAIVLRWTADPAPRLLYCFEEGERGQITIERLLSRIRGSEPDIDPSELIVGSAIAIPGLDQFPKETQIFDGVKAAVTAVLRRVREHLEH